MKAKPPPSVAVEHKRDIYGFTVRPQHLQRYKEYANIYKEEEEERSARWKSFLERQAEFATVNINESSNNDSKVIQYSEGSDSAVVDNCSKEENYKTNGVPVEKIEKVGTHRVQIWCPISPSLCQIERMMSLRVKKKKHAMSVIQPVKKDGENITPLDEEKLSEDSEEEFYDAEKPDPSLESISNNNGNADGSADGDIGNVDQSWKDELECLVQGGLPMALRGELWQAFVGVGTRRVEGYYDSLLSQVDLEECNSVDSPQSVTTDDLQKLSPTSATEKWKGQIEKDLPRTFPGHPALDEDGRNALRRLLTAYAMHNPSVGYCQAMNFFAALLLLLMPEENAFWTLVGIIDDYFDGYYSEDMIEAQVDQLVVEELIRERFTKLVNHLDYLGVQLAWVTGPWFLSIFMNMLPWESVLRMWDVLLFDGSRVMLFRIALALMELYGPALVTTKDAGDAVTLLQALAGSTFDSSQLVLTACMGYLAVNEMKVQELRNKHRPSVLAAMEEREKGLWRDSKGLASKLYNFKRDPGSLVSVTNPPRSLGELMNGDIYEPDSVSLNADSELDLKEQVMWLKVELCRLLDEKRSAILRADEFETALMEIVQQDNRRELSAKVEQLEQEVIELRQALADKHEQEKVMVQVLMRVEQEQKVTEDARVFAEQDAAAQRYAAFVLQEKYEEALASLAKMENRAVMAESMLEATIQYQSSQSKAQQSLTPSPRTPTSPSQAMQEASQDWQPKKIGLLSRPFVLGWRDKNKDGSQPRPTDGESPPERKSSKDEEVPNGTTTTELCKDEEQYEAIELGNTEHVVATLDKDLNGATTGYPRATSGESLQLCQT